MNTAKLEDKGYVASAADIEQITKDTLDAGESVNLSRTTYLRALVGTVQSQLGFVQMKRKVGVPPPMDEAETKRQLEAIEQVHARFYASVLKVVEARPIQEDDRGKDRKAVYASRATFARTAKATLRAWVNSGNNLKGVIASRVTKYGLQAEIAERETTPRAPSERFLSGLAERLLARIRQAKSPEDSIKLLETVINRLVSGLMDLGAETTTKLEEALADGKLLETQTGLVYAARAEPAHAPGVAAPSLRGRKSKYAIDALAA